MTDSDLYAEAHAILAEVGEHIRTPVNDAELLRLHSNAIFALPSAGLVIRIATKPGAWERIAASVAVTRWLSARGFPCVVPVDFDEQPLVVHERSVSIWRHEPTVDEPGPAGADLGRILRTLHEQPVPPHPLSRFTAPFSSVAGAIETTPDAMSTAHRDWLTDRIAQLGELWAGLEFPHPPSLIHGDAHPNNLMRTSSGEILLGDWDHVAIGPREWDLMQIHYTWRRFGRPSADDVEAFTVAYGWDVRDWSGLDTLIAAREISGLSSYIRTALSKPFARKEIARRLDALRECDVMARWDPPPPE
jgi:aminoglycoside phosphotransferase